jgi:hypothetical protein
VVLAAYVRADSRSGGVMRVIRSKNEPRNRAVQAAGVGSGRNQYVHRIERFFQPDPNAPHFGDHSRCDFEGGSFCSECLVILADVVTQGSEANA